MAKRFFSDAEQLSIVNAIKEAERNTSGEVRVHLENKCKKNVLDRASEVFAALNMHKTELRNGVLFYLAVEDKKFAILGDAGINSVVPSNFWDEIKSNCLEKFKAGAFTDGLVQGILTAGRQLKANFPYQSDDVNELPDDISFSEN
ncbi:MAG: TPM domain-containing protein [Cytophagales bacterium]